MAYSSLIFVPKIIDIGQWFVKIISVVWVISFFWDTV